MSLNILRPPGHNDVSLQAVQLDSVPQRWELLSQAEEHRAAGFAHPDLAARFRARRVALKLFAAELTGTDPAALRASYRCPDHGEGPELDHGQPGFLLGDDRLPVSLSLSSSGDWVLLAGAVHDAGTPASAQPALGVDLETVTKVDFPGFEQVALTASEQEAVSASIDPMLLKAQAWVGKEAWAKAIGSGIRAEPNLIESGQPGIIALDPLTLGVPEIYVAALAVLRNGEGMMELPKDPPQEFVA